MQVWEGTAQRMRVAQRVPANGAGSVWAWMVRSHEVPPPEGSQVWVVLPPPMVSTHS